MVPHIGRVISATLIVLMIVVTVLILLLAQHRTDRPPGLRFENNRQFLESFKPKNYDGFGRRILPVYQVLYPVFFVLIIFWAFGHTCFAPRR